MIQRICKTQIRVPTFSLSFSKFWVKFESLLPTKSEVMLFLRVQEPCFEDYWFFKSFNKIRTVEA